MVQYSCPLIAIRRHCPELEWAVDLFPPSLVIAQVDTLIESAGLCEFFDHTQKEKCSRVKRQEQPGKTLVFCRRIDIAKEDPGQASVAKEQRSRPLSLCYHRRQFT